VRLTAFANSTNTSDHRIRAEAGSRSITVASRCLVERAMPNAPGSRQRPARAAARRSSLPSAFRVDRPAGNLGTAPLGPVSARRRSKKTFTSASRRDGGADCSRPSTTISARSDQRTLTSDHGGTYGRRTALTALTASGHFGRPGSPLSRRCLRRWTPPRGAASVLICRVDTSGDLGDRCRCPRGRPPPRSTSQVTRAIHRPCGRG